MISFYLRPMIVIGGASDAALDDQEAFQEYPQTDSARMHCKYTARPDSVERIPLFVQKVLVTTKKRAINST